MPGGLIQIASYGSQELTLTGNPQITYFRIVFRRYTNFGIRTVEIAFDNPVDFGSTSTLTIPKIGDLLTKTTLKIKLPSYDLKNLNDVLINDANNDGKKVDLQKYYIYYDFFINFINKLKNIINKFFKQKNNNTKSITYIQDLSNYILKFIQEDEYLEFFNIVNFFLYNETETQQNNTQNLYINTYTNASLFYINNNQVLTYIYNSYNENEYSFDIFEFMIRANMDILTNLNDVLYEKLKKVYSKENIITMGWSKKIGIFIMENIELFIGSNLITRMSSNYLDTYGQLNYKNVEIYNKMIGDDPELNEPVVKNTSKYLYIPFPFWYQNNFGLSFPLIALQYNNMQIKIKFRNLIDSIFFNIPNNNSFTNDNLRNKIADLILSNAVNIFNSEIEITMLLEYAYLDNIERKKFAQSSHEYLITQVQEITFNNITPNISNLELDFFHCCKTIYWSANQYKYINNVTGKNIYDKYSVNLYEPTYNTNNQYYIKYIEMLYNPIYLFNINTFIEGLNVINKLPVNNNLFLADIQISYSKSSNSVNYNVNPFIFSQLTLNGFSLVAQNSPYFNYLQVYNYFKNTPGLGINIYSFSLNPTETQPFGACNLSRISKTSLNFKLVNPDNNLLNIDINNGYNAIDNLSTSDLNNYKINVGVENYNVIRIIGGIVGVAFTY